MQLRPLLVQNPGLRPHAVVAWWLIVYREWVRVVIFGERVQRREDPALLRGEGRFVDNIDVNGAAIVTFVRSSMAHARIVSIDLDEVPSMPGVLDILTAADLGGAAGPSMPTDVPMLGRSGIVRPLLPDAVVRYVGEPIVAVVTETRAQGEDAVQAAIVDYEPLPVVVDPRDSLSGDVRLFPERDDNVVFSFGEPTPGLFDDCEVVVRAEIVNQRVAPCPLEGRSAMSAWGDDGRLTHWQAGQGAHPVRDRLCEVHGLDPSQVRSISPDVGGGFGAKAWPSPEDVLLPILARRIGRPVRYSDIRTDSMLGIGHGRGQIQRLEIGGTRDGRVLAYRLDVLQDAGAFPRMGAFLPFMTRLMLTGTYDIPKAECIARSVVTNTTPLVAYRGAGRPEAAAAIERAMDLFAAEIGMDATEVRRRNLIAPDRFPFRTATGTSYDSGTYEAGLDLALERADLPALRAEQARRRQRGDVRQLGIGVSVYVEVTAPGGGTEYGEVQILDDGRVRVLTGTSPYGQGHHTSWAMLAAERLGVELDMVEVVHGDTDVIVSGSTTGGSRSVQLGGSNIWRAAGVVADRARELAARLLEADPRDVELTPAGASVIGTPSISIPWARLATEAAEAGEALSAVGDFTEETGTFPSGTHVAVVEVDTETGQVRVVRFIAVDDAGRILNPLLAEGQVHGGVGQGIGQALYEEMVYDSDGNPLTTNFADYAFPSAAEIPSIETVHVETPSPRNDLGAKGIGESGSIGATPAVQSAVVDALSHLGVRHVDLPCTPERVWRAIAAARV